MIGGAYPRIGSKDRPAEINVTGNSVAEVLRDTDADGDVLTFSEPVQVVEVWHSGEGLQDFIINGITIPIAPGGWRSPVAGEPSPEVTIPAGVTCVVSRLV